MKLKKWLSFLFLFSCGLILSLYICGNYLDRFSWMKTPFLRANSSYLGFICVYSIIVFSFFSWTFSFGPGIWKKYHHNKKIFFLAYLFTFDQSLYNKKESTNPKIRQIEKKFIQTDHIISKLMVFMYFVYIPILLCWYAKYRDRISFLLPIGIAICTKIVFILMHLFLPRRQVQLLVKKILLEEE